MFFGGARGLPVLERLVLPATVAAIAARDAGDELLLGEFDEVSSLDEMFALKCAS